MQYVPGKTPEALRLLLGGFRDLLGPKVSEAAKRNPRGPNQGKLTARPLVLTDEMRSRDGKKSRRREARTWKAM